jgi:ankyrin repeat protein
MTPTETFLDAVKRGDAGQIATLLETDPELVHTPDTCGVSVLMLAAYYGHPELAPLLRERGARVGLFEACALGELDALRTTLEAQPGHVNEQSPDGWTPLHMAVFFGHRPLAELLVARGADLAAVSQNGMAVTPLQSALARGSEECAELLVQHGADVHGRPAVGWPPIVYAAANGLAASARLLLERGADPNARDPEGKSALAYAEEKGHPEVAALLRQYGAAG